MTDDRPAPAPDATELLRSPAYLGLLFKRDAPEQASVVIGAAGSFAAIATLLGSPLAGAFLLMEAGGIGGAMMGVVLVPGLLAAGVGALIFVGLDSWTGFGTFSLAVPGLAPAGSPTGSQLLWALVIGQAGPRPRSATGPRHQRRRGPFTRYG